MTYDLQYFGFDPALLQISCGQEEGVLLSGSKLDASPPTRTRCGRWVSAVRPSVRLIHNSWLLRWHFVLSLHDTYQLLSNAIFFLGGSMMRIANMFACQGTKETKMLFLAALYLKNESMIWSLPLDYSCPRSCEIRAALSSWDMLDFVHCEAITVNTCGWVY